MTIKGREIFSYGDPEAEDVLIQMTDEHEREGLEREAAHIRTLAPGRPFRLIAVNTERWNHDLSPWPAPPVFGTEGFGDGATETLRFLLGELLPALSEEGAERFRLGGYSLAGLFALWAVTRTDRFAGAAAASPSLWFPGFSEYLRQTPVRTEAVYLSLGDREEKTRNPVMARVGEAARESFEILKEHGAGCVLEWNPGNHFRDPELRTAKAFAWLLNRPRL